MDEGSQQAPPTTAVVGMPPPSKPKRLGKNLEYFEDRVIGQGVFGIVYYGRTKPEGKPVAVKLFRDLPSSYSRASLANVVGASGDDDLRTSNENDRRDRPRDGGDGGKILFPEEIKVLILLKSVGCPNIIEHHSSWNRRKDKGERGSSKGSGGEGGPQQQQRQPLPAQGESLYRRSDREFLLVTEYCEGGDLLTLQRRSRTRFSEVAARSLIYQLCNALLVLFQKHIIHRDIKPANLLLTSTDPEKAVLKLADWGMAKSATNSHRQQLRDADFNDDPMQNSAMFYSHVGTPMYKSPERIRQEPYSYKADVYSAGMVLYELMTGRMVRARTQEDLLEAVPRAVRNCYKKYESASQTDGTPCPAPLWLDLMKGMTETNPSERLSIEEVLAHPWFRPENGPELPPLTLTLPLLRPSSKHASSPSSAPSEATDAPRPGALGMPKAAAGGPPPQQPSQGVPTAPPEEDSDDLDDEHSAQREGEPCSASTRAAHTSECATVGGGEGPSVTKDSPKHESPEPRLEQEPSRRAQPSALYIPPLPSSVAHPSSPGLFSQRQSPFVPSSNMNWWTVLASFPLPCTATELSPFFPFPSHAAPLSASGSRSGAAQGASPMKQLPSECGPHVVTYAVRSFVISIVDGALALCQDTTKALVLIAFAKGILNAGYAVFVRELELHGCLMPPPADGHQGAAVAGGEETLLISREYSVLHSVWDETRSVLEEQLRAVMADCPESQKERFLGIVYDTPPDDGGGGGRAEEATRAEALLFAHAAKMAMYAALEDHMNDEADSSSDGEKEEREEFHGRESAKGDDGPLEERAELSRARALLRVVLQQAILTEEEVGYRGDPRAVGDTCGSDGAHATRVFLLHVPLLPAPQEHAHSWGGPAVDQLMSALVAYALSAKNRRPWSAHQR